MNRMTNKFHCDFRHMPKGVHLKTVELFSGTASFSRIALQNGMQIKTYDIAESADELVERTHTKCDILDCSVAYPMQPFMLWASPPCTTFSIASCSTHWTPDKQPKTDACLRGLAILHRTIEWISLYQPTWWFIENPRGIMRKVIDPIFKSHCINPIRHTITYCQYGDTRMKPTDIWTNADWWNPRPMCKNGMPCHESAPRGSRTGTQGLKNNRARSVIPPELFQEIFEQLEDKGYEHE